MTSRIFYYYFFVIWGIVIVIFLMFYCPYYYSKSMKELRASEELSRQWLSYGTYGYGWFDGAPGVTVTTQHHASATPVVRPPYPVDNQCRPPGTSQLPYPTTPAHPLPNASYPPPVGAAPHAPVGAAPYPPMGPTPYPPSGPTPYPPSGPTPYPPSGPTPYPPSSAPVARNDSSDHPPSYFEAVGQQPPPGTEAISHEAYSKQSPYNPAY